MFDVEKAIKEWKQGLRKNSRYEDGDIEELESHLRDRIEELMNDGQPSNHAFTTATYEIGDLNLVGEELYKSKTKGSTILPVSGSAFSSSLFPNYIKTTLRVLKKNPIYSSINVLGLATGLASCFLILIYLQFQFSFDSFHTNSEQIYRLNKIITPKTGGTEFHAISSGLMGPQLKADFPEIESFTRVRPWFSDVLVSYEENHLNLDRFVLADSSFFSMFDFKLLSGDKTKALIDPLSMVISEDVAAHFFGDENPIGKSLKGLNGLSYTVSGVVENAPINSHIDYDVLVSWSSTGPSALKFSWLNTWLTQALYTYIRVNDKADIDALNGKFQGFMETHFNERADQYTLYLQPFNEVYLHSSEIQHDGELRTGNRSNSAIFSAIALLVLFIAGINFVNLTTAKSMERSREVGVRKVLGAQQNQLGIQYLWESLLLSLVAFVAALGITVLGKPVLYYIGVPSEVTLLFENLNLLLLMFGITLATGIISGVYPAIVLSSFKPVDVLYNKIGPRFGSRNSFQKALVTLQFSLSIFLIISTLVVFKQMNFISNKDLGFNKDQVLVLPIGKTSISDQSEAFKQVLLNNAAILNATASNTIPGYGISGYGINPEGKTSDESWTSNVFKISDNNFLQTYGIEMKRGRFFSNNFSMDDLTGVIINEALIQSLGWDEAETIGKRLDIPGEKDHGIIIGVVKNFNTASLHTKVDPLVIIKHPSYAYVSLKVSASNLSETIAFIASTWQEFDPAYPFEYTFLDQTFASFYTNEQKMLRVLALITGLAILVSCLGLFGLSTFVVTKQRKEIGIRKVLGSSVSKIILLISKDFMLLVLLGFIVAVPASLWITSKWLNEFIYRTSVGIEIFLFAGFITAFLALAAVALQAIKAATSNPVDSLRSE